MDKNLNIIARELFGKLRSQFPKIKLGDGESKPTDNPIEARFFEFDFVFEGENLGRITVTISDKDENSDGEQDGLVIIYSNDIVGDQPDLAKKKFFAFLKEMREFARQKFMNFDTRDIAKSNLEKRDYKYLAKNSGEGNMTESKLYGTSMTSYQQLGETKLILKHSAPVNLEHAAGRTQRIESIYIENAQGERFKYPFRHLNGARALAQHVGHGGTPYDAIGGHIIGLSEELSNLRMFKHYVDRNPTISEAMGSIHSKVMERIDGVKKEIFSLQNSGYYETFAESFAETEKTEIPEDILNDWVDRLTIRTFNEELKNVFPYIFKLVDESDIPVKELTADDLLGEVSANSAEHIPKDYQTKEPLKKGPDGKWRNSKGEERDSMYGTPVGGVPGLGVPRGMMGAKKTKESLEDPFESFEHEVKRIIGEGTDVFSDDEQASQSAVERLNQLVANPFPVGTDGNNAIESLADVIDDDELMEVFKELADIDPEMDVREILKDYITIKDQEYGSDILSKVTFPEGDTTEVTPPTTEPLATEPAPEAPAEAGAPAEAPPAPAPQPAAESREHDDPPFDPDPKPSKKVTPGKNGQGYSQARHLARQGLKQAVEKAKKAGATSETIINVSGKQLTLAEVMEKIEIAEAKEHKHKEIIEYVKSMFDETSGQFPKGEMGVKIAVEKKFGDEVGPLAEKIMGKLQSMNEMSRVKKLAGVSEGDNFTWSNDDNGKKTSGTDKAGYDNVMSKFKGMAGNMDTPFGKMDLSDPNTAAGNIHKGVQDKMSSMMKGMNMPGMDATPNMPGSSTPSTAPATKQDPKDVLKKLPPEKIQSMDGDQAKKMLADLKKMAGLAN